MIAPKMLKWYFSENVRQVSLYTGHTGEEHLSTEEGSEENVFQQSANRY